MRVAVPSDTVQGLEGTRSGHFGHSPYFTIATIEDGKVEKVEVFKNVDHDEHGCGGVIQYALSLGIDAIVVLGMGQPPFRAFTQNGAADIQGNCIRRRPAWIKLHLKARSLQSRHAASRA